MPDSAIFEKPVSRPAEAPCCADSPHFDFGFAAGVCLRSMRQKLAVNLPIVGSPQCFAGLPFFIHRDEHGKLFVSVASDKLFHLAAAPLLDFDSQSTRYRAAALS